MWRLIYRVILAFNIGLQWHFNIKRLFTVSQTINASIIYYGYNKLSDCSAELIIIIMQEKRDLSSFLDS